MPPEDDAGTVETTEVATEPTVDNSLYEAKIAELTVKVAELEAALEAKDAEIVAAKAANYDLLMNSSATTIPDADAGDEIAPDVVEEITPDDLFGEDD
jgi:hypothetical protein